MVVLSSTIIDGSFDLEVIFGLIEQSLVLILYILNSKV
jgi:hypothetical protein